MIENLRRELRLAMGRDDSKRKAKTLSRDAGVHDTALRDLLNKRTTDPRAKTLLALAKELRIPPSLLFSERVAVQGEVGPDGQVVVVAKEFDMVPRPPLAEEVLFALRLWTGEVAFFGNEREADPSAFLGELCVVELARGGRLLGKLTAGANAGTYSVAAHGAAYENVVLAWAAPVLWTASERALRNL